MNLLLHVIAILPGLLIGFSILWLDRYEKESKVILFLCFLSGIAITWPAMYLESFGVQWGIDPPQSFIGLFILSFIVVAFTEEFLKTIVLYIFPFQTKGFDHPFDGIVYAMMIGMGFATLENIIYAGQTELGTILLRAFTAVPAHAVFAVVCGYYFGLAKMNPANRWTLMLKGFGLAVLLHGLYDFFILQEYYEWMMLIAIFVLSVGMYVAIVMIKSSKKAAVADLPEIANPEMTKPESLGSGNPKI